MNFKKMTTRPSIPTKKKEKEKGKRLVSPLLMKHTARVCLKTTILQTCPSPPKAYKDLSDA